MRGPVLEVHTPPQPRHPCKSTVSCILVAYHPPTQARSPSLFWRGRVIADILARKWWWPFRGAGFKHLTGPSWWGPSHLSLTTTKSNFASYLLLKCSNPFSDAIPTNLSMLVTWWQQPFHISSPLMQTLNNWRLQWSTYVTIFQSSYYRLSSGNLFCSFSLNPEPWTLNSASGQILMRWDHPTSIPEAAPLRGE